MAVSAKRTIFPAGAVVSNPADSTIKKNFYGTNLTWTGIPLAAGQDRRVFSGSSVLPVDLDHAQPVPIRARLRQTTAGTGNVLLQFNYIRRTAGEDRDSQPLQNINEPSPGIAIPVPGAVGSEFLVSFSIPTFALSPVVVGDELVWSFRRIGSNALDTFGGEVALLWLMIEYPEAVIWVQNPLSGLTIDGNNDIAVQPDNSTLEINGLNEVIVKAAGITNNELAVECVQNQNLAENEPADYGFYAVDTPYAVTSALGYPVMAAVLSTENQPAPGSSFWRGETVTGGSSGATGKFMGFANPQSHPAVDSMWLLPLSGVPFLVGETLTGFLSGATCDVSPPLNFQAGQSPDGTRTDFELSIRLALSGNLCVKGSVKVYRNKELMRLVENNDFLFNDPNSVSVSPLGDVKFGEAPAYGDEIVIYYQPKPPG